MTNGNCDSLIGLNYFFSALLFEQICRNYYYSLTLKLNATPAYRVLSAAI